MGKMIELIERKIAFDLGDVVFFLHESRVVQKKIRIIRIPDIIYQPNDEFHLQVDKNRVESKIKYGFGKDVITHSDFIWCDYKNDPIMINADMCFKTKDELLKSL